MKTSLSHLVAIIQYWPTKLTAICFVLACVLGSEVWAQDSPSADDEQPSRQQPPNIGESESAEIKPTDNQRLFELRVQSIQQRIEVLKNELNRRQAEERQLEKEATDMVLDPPSIPTKSPDSTTAGDQTSHSPSHSEVQDGENKSAAASGFQLVAMPANSLELGNSLFSTGNYSQALRSYESLLQDEKNAVDRAWIKCFAANCYRLQGNVSAAEKLYREVAGAKVNVYAADQAQWYLDYVGRKKQVVADLKLMDEELQAYQGTGEASHGK